MTAAELDLPEGYDRDLWRLVFKGISKREIELYWTLEDVWDGVQALDIEDDIELIANRKSRAT